MSDEYVNPGPVGDQPAGSPTEGSPTDGSVTDGSLTDGPAEDRGPGSASAGRPGESGHVHATPGDEPSPVPDTVEEALAEAEAAVLTDIEMLEKERDDYLDALRRLQADFENFKKRTAKQQTDVVERAAQSIVEKLLPVLDAADLAIAHGADETVAQVAGLLLDTLVREGLEGVDPKPGEAFDPTVHEAVAHEPGDGGEQQVTDLLRAGYRWRGSLLRPAMVKVRG
ncbi:MAG: nucleotide exchange factor GrpE [Acidimicrobiales bacterium]